MLGSLMILAAAYGGDVQREYWVEGMQCGGCAFGVEKALKRVGIERNQFVEIAYGEPSAQGPVGHIKVRFENGTYRGVQTDCRVVTAIEEYAGYNAYFDPSDKHPCSKVKK